MRFRRLSLMFVLGLGLAMGLTPPAAAQTKPKPGAVQVDPRLEKFKQELLTEIDAMKDFTQQGVDQIFSFGELGYQELETSKYLTGILEKNGFTIERGVADTPTAWMATWGSGKPVVAIGSDIDGIPQSSQKPGVAYHDPIVAGAPGHGEGHNSGQVLNLTAVLAVKKIMEREKLPGTIKVWPGVAEELLSGKAYLVRAGLFKNVDIAIFCHVGSSMGTGWGEGGGNGLISVEYLFEGTASHAGSSPWRGRSAVDAVELMDIGWNFRREHLRIQQRSHSVITDGGAQPNVVPPTAAVWYYFREANPPQIKELRAIGDDIAKGAALMTGTKVTSRVLGAAYPQHMNKTLAETMYANIKRVGLPQWSADDVALAKTVQRNLKVPEVGLVTEIGELRGRESFPDDEKRGGGSDDIGDISWNVPTVSLSYPANFSAGPGHSWVNAIAMATPIAHKGVTAGAKVQALTLLDVFMRPEVVKQAWDYFNTVQTKNAKYEPLLVATDKVPVWLNKETMDRYRPEMRKYYFDPTKYKTYLEQLGIKYPTLTPPPATTGGEQ